MTGTFLITINYKEYLFLSIVFNTTIMPEITRKKEQFGLIPLFDLIFMHLTICRAVCRRSARCQSQDKNSKGYYGKKNSFHNNG